ncbi:hypothetical protein GCM10010967_30690 [Dyadobacter beijingensis]|uniref:Uncharacterized protein n=1 Tax=Dyadobacter beijingensis TaxID=365489 RepID=A0ABQ2HYB1_9BACT|nr:hypothetical protein [Dyadobacter beijingensis]GGM95168.1 hypothetical protein GCM10010967_30690 [Dyadobacter beijingensis]
MKEIAKEAWNYTFTEHRPGDYVLSVVCGGAGMYDFAIRLTPAQVTAWERDGLPYILKLVEQVRHDQGPFTAQKA